ncbi:helix-turn-helix domain-containing protein [Horticoccus sp. 23ND18S-11]
MASTNQMPLQEPIGLLEAPIEPRMKQPEDMRRVGELDDNGVDAEHVGPAGHFVTARTNLEGLSPREQSVLALPTKGYLHKEFSEDLGVSVPSVNTYIRRIYEKLQVHSRSQAVAKFLKQSR